MLGPYTEMDSLWSRCEMCAGYTTTSRLLCLLNNMEQGADRRPRTTAYVHGVEISPGKNDVHN